jgi:hypothetical protein
MNNYIVSEAELGYLLNEIRKSQSSDIAYDLDGKIGGIAELVEWVIKSSPYKAKAEPTKELQKC